MGKKLEEIKYLLTDPECAYYLHGTGRLDNSENFEIIESIFQKGLRASNGSMYWTTVCFGTGDDIRNNWEEFKYEMNNWKHLGSKNIVIVRVPMKYLIFGADASLGENDFAIYNNIEDLETGIITRYVNPKLIVGCYHVKRGTFSINSNFEETLSPETENELQIKYMKGVEKFKERINSSSANPLLCGKKKSEIIHHDEEIEDVEDIDLSGAWDIEFWK